ncbi:unnamed protein product [Rhizoctonia solani]|uniref:F-box domain-containing protein n=1 Tax=Rhizoctonia solani TaxID=456999 RepID=A0A8H3AGG8_9AGAM|nr:unnamed protein product [Rhizoctonia solani]
MTPNDPEEDSKLWQKVLGVLFLPSSQHYQQLHALSIGNALMFVTNPTANDGLSVFTEAPKLQHLRLRGLVVNSDSCPNSYPSLQSVSVINTCLDRPIHSLLRRMPNLERLSLVLMERYDTNSDIGNSEDELRLDKLRTLRILRPAEDQLHDINDLLALLRAPNLRHFEWEVNYEPLATPLDFWHRCASRFQTLTSLHLMGFPSEFPGGVAALQVLVGWLQSLQDLESFILIFARTCVYSIVETDSGIRTILERLSETHDGTPAYCAKLGSLHIGPVLPRELPTLQSVVQSRPHLSSGSVHILQYVDTKRSAGDVSWFQTNVSNFAIETVSGHGRGFHYGGRHRYVGGALRKYPNVFSERIYFDQAEQSEPSA